MKIIPLILCGGSGTRLWPASRESYPKQFLSFGDQKSLFQATASRLVETSLKDLMDRPIILTGADYRFLVAEQLRALNITADLVLEPCRRDSAAAIAAGTLLARKREGDYLVLVMASDHAIPEAEAFAHSIRDALYAAEKGSIVTFGITPKRPATEYGYIAPSTPIGEGRVHRVEAFVEKPDAQKAKDYIAKGYLWNSGNFLFDPKILAQEMQRLAPEIWGPVSHAVKDAERDLDFVRLEEKSFAKARAASFDYAVMEKTDRAAVAPSTFRWSDVGSWAAIAELSSKDQNNNVGIGDTLFLNAQSSFAHSENILTTVVGLDNVMVITTRDAVLVAPLEATADIKALVEKLKKAGRREATEHTKAYRPWGNYESLDYKDRYQVKRITVLPGAKLSLQSHIHRSEHWIVVKGTACVTVGDKVELLTENQSTFVPLGSVHRLENPGKVPLELIEVQTGSYLGEDDIVRYEDSYNRT